MCKPTNNRKPQINGCMSTVALMIIAILTVFGGAHGGISSGKGVSIGPNNRPVENSGCMIYIVPLFGIIGGIADLIGKIVA